MTRREAILKHLQEGHWAVSINVIAGEKFYQCYRLRNRGETDHSGNRETDDEIFMDRLTAEAKCRDLNGLELPGDPTRWDQHPMNW